MPQLLAQSSRPNVTLQIRQLAHKTAELASSKQASDIVLLDVTDIASFADYFLILTADSTRQMNAIREDIVKSLAEVSIRLDHQEGTADLKDWIAFCLKMVRQKGRITLVHRADHLDRIIGLLHGRAGDMTVYPIWSKADADAPLRVIVSARKGVASPLTMRRGIVLHDEGGAYLPETDRLLRNPMALPGF